MISGKHGDCDCIEQAPICHTNLQQADRYLKSLRDTNRDLENLQPVSQCSDNILLYPPGSKCEALQLGVHLILLYFIRSHS